MLQPNQMQVDLSAVVGIFATTVSIATLLIVSIARITIANREKEIDLKLGEMHKKLEAIDARVHIEEKATIRQDGEMKAALATSTRLEGDVEKIDARLERQSIVDRQEASRRSDRGPYHPTPGAYQGLRAGGGSLTPPRPDTSRKDR